RLIVLSANMSEHVVGGGGSPHPQAALPSGTSVRSGPALLRGTVIDSFMPTCARRGLRRDDDVVFQIWTPAARFKRLRASVARQGRWGRAVSRGAMQSFGEPPASHGLLS